MVNIAFRFFFRRVRASSSMRWFALICKHRSRWNRIGEKVNAHRNISFFFFGHMSSCQWGYTLLYVIRYHALKLKKKKERKKNFTQTPKILCLSFRFAFTLTTRSSSLFFSFFQRKRTNNQSPLPCSSLLFFGNSYEEQSKESCSCAIESDFRFVGHTANSNGIGHTFVNNDDDDDTQWCINTLMA